MQVLSGKRSKDMADEAAIQLKMILDYVFTHSRQPIRIPSQAGMKNRNDLRSNPTARGVSWHGDHADF